jgi:hypothetical protein
MIEMATFNQIFKTTSDPKKIDRTKAVTLEPPDALLASNITS